MSEPGFYTIFTSNTPVECHIIKGRLLAEGIDAVIFDENIVWGHPFRAVAIGGVRLSVPFHQVSRAEQILWLIQKNTLTDLQGDYALDKALSEAIIFQDEILSIKNHIREIGSVPKNIEKIQTDQLSASEITTLISGERDFLKYRDKKFSFCWKDFWYELFDFNRDFFAYLHPRPVNWYMEKELVDHWCDNKDNKKKIHCPECYSDDVAFGNAIDTTWRLLYVIFSFLLLAPIPFFYKKHHCFNCGHNFRKAKRNQKLRIKTK